MIVRGKGRSRISSQMFSHLKETGVLANKQMDIYEHLYLHGPLTANEVFRGLYGSLSIVNSNVHARLNELVKMGCVAELGTIICGVTGNGVTAYDVTPNCPNKPETVKEPKKIALQQVYENIKDYMAEINVPYDKRKQVEEFIKNGLEKDSIRARSWLDSPNRLRRR